MYGLVTGVSGNRESVERSYELQAIRGLDVEMKSVAG